MCVWVGKHACAYVEFMGNSLLSFCMCYILMHKCNKFLLHGVYGQGSKSVVRDRLRRADAQDAEVGVPFTLFSSFAVSCYKTV